jgi:hypothetical protein
MILRICSRIQLIQTSLQLRCSLRLRLHHDVRDRYRSPRARLLREKLLLAKTFRDQGPVSLQAANQKRRARLISNLNRDLG